MSMQKIFAVAVLGGLMSLGLAGQSEAGVKGRTFDTDFDTAGETFQANLTFSNGSTMTYDGAGGVFDGSFFEVDLVIASFFIYNLNSVDRFTGLGVSILSRRIQGIVVQDDFGQIDFVGTAVSPAKKAPSGDVGANGPSK